MPLQIVAIHFTYTHPCVQSHPNPADVRHRLTILETHIAEILKLKMTVAETPHVASRLTT